MPLISEQYPNLMNGVSQQAATLRMSSQSEEQVNGYSSVVEGMNKRPPTQHVAKLNGLQGTPYIYTVNRDSTEQYVIVIDTGRVRVFDLDGAERIVMDPTDGAYLNDADPRGAFRAATIGDYTLILNRNKTVAHGSATKRGAETDKLLFVKGVNYGVKYEVKRNGVVEATFETPAATDNPKIGTDLVATDLHGKLVAKAFAGVSFEVVDNIIRIHGDTSDRWEFSDDFTGIYTEVVNPEMPKLSDLPLKAPNGMYIKITGDSSSEEDDYYVQFKTNDTAADATIGEGYWEETIGPDLEFALDAATMPHQLRRNSDGSFTFGPITWGERAVGDIQTAPWPSFVGAQISDIYYDRNRLCFLSGPNVVMSRARALFEFFPTTVTTILDDGPIDVAASGSRVINLRAAVPFNREVMLFADQTQLTIDVENLLASEPPSLDVLTDYETDKNVFPVAVGKNLYFTVTRGAYTSVMEYYIVTETDTTDAADITKHVPTYIPHGAFKLSASPTTDVLFCLTDTAPNRVYVYKYYWRGVEKLQSSWSYWEFDPTCEILNVDFIKDTAYFLIRYADGIYLEKMLVSEGQVDDNIDFVFRLDRRVSNAQASKFAVRNLGGGSYETDFYIPYEVSGDVTVAITAGGLTPLPVGSQPEVLATAIDNGQTKITVAGDVQLANFYVGSRYVMRYVFSEPVIKTNATQGGLATITGGRLQINKWLMSFTRTGYFRAEVEAGAGRGKYTYIYDGKILGTSSAVIGKAVITEGVFGFRVNANAKNVKITLINDSVLPSYFTSCEWEGRFKRRTSR